MQGSHLILPCVWQSDVNIGHCAVRKTIRLDISFRIFPTLKILQVCDCYTGGLKFKMFDCCSSFENTFNLAYENLQKQKVQWCAWWVAELTRNHQCWNLTNNFYNIARPLELPLLEKFWYPRRIRDFLRVSVEAPIHLLLLCSLFLFSAKYVSVHHNHVTFEENVTSWHRVRAFYWFRVRIQLKPCTLFNWLFRY